MVNDDRPPDVALEHGGDPPASHRRELDRLAVGVYVSPFVIRETHAEQRVAEELRHQRRLVQSPKELEVTLGGRDKQCHGVGVDLFELSGTSVSRFMTTPATTPAFESPLSVTFLWKVGPQLGSFCASWWRVRHLKS